VSKIEKKIKRELAKKELIPKETIMEQLLPQLKLEVKEQARQQGQLIEVIDAEWTKNGILVWITH
jgi:hypothetical protein